MRSRFEEYREDEHLDEPVTLTGRQLRSLQRGSRTGMIATALAVVAVGLSVFSLVRAGNDAGVSASMTPAVAAPLPAAATDTVPSPTPLPQPLEAAGTPTPAARGATKTTQAEPAKPAASTTTPASKPSSREAPASSREPVTVRAVAPTPAPVAAPVPAPVGATKAASDSSKQ